MKVEIYQKKNSIHWNRFYKKFSLSQASNFAKFVFRKIKKKKLSRLSLIDIGCGNGRDSIYFSKKKIETTGLDASKIAIKNNLKNFKKITFLNKNICSKNFNINKKFDIIYARFFLHAINYKNQNLFLKNIKKILKKKGVIFLEFRTIKDKMMLKGKKLSNNERVFGHYRRFIDVQEFIIDLKKVGFKINYISQSNNFANFKNEKPHVCRMKIKFNK